MAEINEMIVPNYLIIKVSAPGEEDYYSVEEDIGLGICTHITSAATLEQAKYFLKDYKNKKVKRTLVHHEILSGDEVEDLKQSS